VSAPYLVFAGLYLAGLVVRDGYEYLKQRDRVDTQDVRVFAVVFTSMCVMLGSWFAMGVFDPTRLPVPDVVRWAGLIAVVVGAVLAVGGVVQLRGVENIDHLVTTGLFSRIRHPMYAGFILWILGWSVFQAAPASLALGRLGVASIAWWRRLEEADLAVCYGESSERYREQTWF
jgi:protein-S-isoprenylcysteine O-methyltransferase Ste14